MKNFVYYISLIFLPFYSFSQKTVIKGHIDTLDGSFKRILYYKPFTNFRNKEIHSEQIADKDGNFTLSFDLQNPCFVKLIIYDEPLSFLLEPNDTVSIEIINPSKIINKSAWRKEIQQGKATKDWLYIKGNNSTGNIYYNTHFNFVPFTKYENIRKILTDLEDKSVEQLFVALQTEYKKQTYWADSLLEIKKISPTFHHYMVNDIYAALSSEVVNYTENKSTIRSQKNLKYLIQKSDQLQQKIFEMYDPKDKSLKFGNYGFSYIFAYYQIQAKTKKIDSLEVLCSDAPQFALATEKEKSFFWGFCIFACLNGVNEFDLCKMTKQYIEKYPLGEFTAYFRDLNLCEAKKQLQKIHYLQNEDNDLFILLNKFLGKRLYIDLWATWCRPCKEEFKNYSQDLTLFFKQNNIESLFICINDEKEAWKKNITFFNLEGYHIIANAKLLNSLQTIVFDDKDIELPRYLLVDENGKILTAEASRPSTLSLRSEILKFFAH